MRNPFFSVIRLNAEGGQIDGIPASPAIKAMGVATDLLHSGRFHEAAEAAEQALSLIDADGTDDENRLRTAVGFVRAWALLSETYAKVEPLVAETIRVNPYGMGRLAKKLAKWKDL